MIITSEQLNLSLSESGQTPWQDPWGNNYGWPGQTINGVDSTRRKPHANIRQKTFIITAFHYLYPQKGKKRSRVGDVG